MPEDCPHGAPCACPKLTVGDVDTVSKVMPASGQNVRVATFSFEQVFQEHVPYVGRCLRYLGVAEADVEDACQEVFLVVHRRRGVFESPVALQAWLRRICVFVAQNQRRSVRRRREVDTCEPVEPSGPPNQQQHMEREELRVRLLRLLDDLTDEQRTVFVLYEIERMTMADVAAIAQCPLQTAYSRLHAARGKIERAILGQQTEER